MTKYKAQTCCFSGHRNLPRERIHEIEKQLKDVLCKLIENGYCYFGAGSALGFDTLAAKAVLELKVKYPHIKLILVLPYKSQADGWTNHNRRIYENLKNNADKVVYTSMEYYDGCMYKRNRHLVDFSSVCVTYLTKPYGGTFYTVEYAKTKSVKIINLSQQQKIPPFRTR